MSDDTPSGKIAGAMAKLRSAVARGSLVDVFVEDDGEGVVRQYLSTLPVELLRTGVLWYLDDGMHVPSRWIPVEEFVDTDFGGGRDQHMLTICGVRWWIGETKEDVLGWKDGLRRWAFGEFLEEALRPSERERLRERFESFVSSRMYFASSHRAKLLREDCYESALAHKRSFLKLMLYALESQYSDGVDHLAIAWAASRHGPDTWTEEHERATQGKRRELVASWNDEFIARGMP